MTILAYPNLHFLIYLTVNKYKYKRSQKLRGHYPLCPLPLRPRLILLVIIITKAQRYDIIGKCCLKDVNSSTYNLHFLFLCDRPTLLLFVTTCDIYRVYQNISRYSRLMSSLISDGVYMFP